MFCRRICHKKLLSSGRRWWSASYTTHPSPPSGVTSGRNHLATGFWSQDYIPRQESTLFCPARKLNTPCMKMCRFLTQAMVDIPVGEVVDVPLAQTGEGIAECEILKWFVKEEDEVEEFQPLCEVQSDKATIEITSRYKGKIFQVLYVPGDIVKVGETLLKMAVGESHVHSEAYDGSKNVKSENSEICDSDGKTPAVKRSSNQIGALSTPAVRNLAKQFGININDVHGTGDEGRVSKEDVLKYAAERGIIEDVRPKEKYHDASYGLEYEDKTVQLRGFHRAMVKSMTLAAKIPHFHYVEEINCDALVELKSSFQKEKSDPEVKHTFLPLLIKSLSMALSKYPLLNSSFNEELHEVILKGSHNIGIAMATPYGLVVPNIKKVQSLSILEITKELSRLQQLALANKLSPDDISGGTITLSNIGAIGGKFGLPLINVPEVSIIALGRIQKVPRLTDDGNVYPTSLMTVNLGADHRVLDGATVARFCNEWKLYIEKPELLMLHMR